MNRYQELSFALGGGAVVARLGDIAVDWRGRIAGTAGRLFLDFVAADGIFPLSWQGGVIRECAFMTEFVRGDAAYCYLQLHVLEPGGKYAIENHVYRRDGECLTEAELGTVPGFEGIAGRFHTGSELPLFVLFKPNIANNLDPENPLGISVYANAIDQLMACDNIFDSFNSDPRGSAARTASRTSTPTTWCSICCRRTRRTSPPCRRWRPRCAFRSI